jgi:hypothetical protein
MKTRNLFLSFLKSLTTTLLILLFLFFYYPLSAQRTTINIGTSEWKFTKVKPHDIANIASTIKPVISGENLPLTINIDLQKTYSVAFLRIFLPDTLVKWLGYKVETSLSGNDKDWATLNDRLWDTESPRLFTISNFNEIKNVPFKSLPSPFPCVESFLTGQTRYIKITIATAEGNNKVKLIPQIKNIEVWGALPDENMEAGYNKNNFDDNSWETVGIPHCFNDKDTYLNASSTLMWRGTAWYRKHLNVGKQQSNQRILLEFRGVNLGMALYVNGKFIPGTSSVQQTGEVTHVGGFLPFVVDITNAVNFGEDNLIAVRVSNAQNSFYTWPCFEYYEGFGMSWGGIVCPVYLHEVNNIHIPVDAASVNGQWGTYTSTRSADSARAVVALMTNIVNDGESDKMVTLVTSIIDADARILFSESLTKNIAPHNRERFDQSATIANPHLWYPNNSPYGKPYLYRVIRKVLVGGNVADSIEYPLGIRVITWDNDYCYVNGKKHILRGFGHRNIYPALGSAIPEELQWKDIELIARAGGNVLRVGHVPATKEMVQACDALGIMVIQNSGDNEWSLANEPALSYKKDFDREMLIAFRNHPSITVWESNNGIAHGKNIYSPKSTYEIVKELDSVQPRIVESRDTSDFFPSGDKLMIGYTNRYAKVEGSPSINMEVYGAVWDGGKSWNIARFDYENEKTFVNWYIDNYNSDLKNRACGWIDWMLAETQGEAYTIYLNGWYKQKSLGSSAMDGNRFPKLKYEIYKNALWVSYAEKPGVVLQSSWNLSGLQTVDAWSNCPAVELFLNGKSLGTRTPDSLTHRCSWENVSWKPGTLKASGHDNHHSEVCSDSRTTAGTPDHILLSVYPPQVKPGGETFSIMANGTDAAIITVCIVDKDGNWCPLASDNIKFSVSGEGTYCGSYNFCVDRNKPLEYHIPGDSELQAEGGLMRIAVRSTFKAGKVTVTASSDKLGSAVVSYKTFDR